MCQFCPVLTPYGQAQIVKERVRELLSRLTGEWRERVLKELTAEGRPDG